MKQKIAFLIPVLALNLFFAGEIYAQNEIDSSSEGQENNEEKEEEKRHLITVAIGFLEINRRLFNYKKLPMIFHLPFFG